ncbi:fungal-specific transcription factor domain-containing protein [Umbelopsis sp. AD052]|nr:fungal-specific transcription factor domain-containing protein [Umbelopsis sp. AD052]
MEIGDESSQSKRQRVSRACDLCRRKKIKCDGTIPICGNCQAFNLNCGYKDTTKKRGPPKGYIEAIENRLHRMETLLGTLAQGDDPRSQALIAELNAPLETIHGELIRTRPMRRQLNEDDPESSPDTPSLSLTDLPHSVQELDSPLTVDQVNDSLGNLTIDDGGQMRYLGKSSGFYMLQNSRLFHHGAFHFGARLVKRHPAKNGSQLEILNPLEMPPPDLAQHLIDLYFKYFYPTLPILHKKSFMEKLNSEDEDNKPSPLLLNAIFAIASRISPDERVREDPTMPDTAGEIFFERAKFLLDQECDIVSTSAIQALLLLSSHQHGAIKTSRSWIYNGMAFRMAQTLGLNHNCDNWNIPASEREERKRVFWCCFIVDRYTSAGFGRSTVIDERDLDATFPTEEDDPNDDSPPVLEYIRHAVRLSDILGHILRDIYSVKGRQLALTMAPDAIIANLDKALNSWYSSLPKSLKYKPPSCRVGEKAPAPPLPVAQLHMTYYTALILLHRPFIPGPSQPRAPTSFPSLQICTSAAYSILDIVENLLSNGQLRFTLNYAIFHVFTAGTLFVNNAAVPDSYLTFEAKISINKIMRGLDDIESSWTAAARYSNILGELAGLRDINLESDTPFKDRYTSKKRTPPPSIAVPNSPEPSDDDYELPNDSPSTTSADIAPELVSNATPQSFSTVNTPFSSSYPSTLIYPSEQFTTLTKTPTQSPGVHTSMDQFVTPDTTDNNTNKRPYDALGTAFWGMPPSLDIEEWNNYLGNQQGMYRTAPIPSPAQRSASLQHQKTSSQSLGQGQIPNGIFGQMTGSPENLSQQLPQQQTRRSPQSLPIPNSDNGMFFWQ